MKKLLIFVAVIPIIFSCKKEEPVITDPGTQPIKNEFYYRIQGVSDTVIVKLNETTLNTVPGRNTINLNPGDHLIFYISYKDSVGGNLAIWNAGNISPDSTIKYYNSIRRSAANSFAKGDLTFYKGYDDIVRVN